MFIHQDLKLSAFITVIILHIINNKKKYYSYQTFHTFDIYVLKLAVPAIKTVTDTILSINGGEGRNR
jgi:hypothetical protein